MFCQCKSQKDVINELPNKTRAPDNPAAVVDLVNSQTVKKLNGTRQAPIAVQT